MNIAKLIKQLKTKDPTKEVQAVIIGNDGQVVIMNLVSDMVDIDKLLKCFKKKGAAK